MQWLRWTLGLGAVAGMIVSCVPPPEGPRERYEQPRQVTRQPRETTRDPRTVVIDCSGPHRLRILDLDMAPDPVRQGQSINTWHITLQSDRDGDCNTLFTVRDQNEIAGRSQQQTIRPGKAVYIIPALPEYRFQRQDACFNVQANVGGSFTPIEAQQTFCVKARPGSRWSLKGS
jgi:hypothetical protein